jgi:Tfp pilus assembly protein PilX
VDRGAAESLRDRGTTLLVVLWALVALGALALAASVGSIVDVRLATRHRQHAIALAAAESGLARSLDSITLDPARAARADSAAGAEGDGLWACRWAPAGGRLRLAASGSAGGATRTLEVWADPEAGGWRVAAWREVR